MGNNPHPNQIMTKHITLPTSQFSKELFDIILLFLDQSIHHPRLVCKDWNFTILRIERDKIHGQTIFIAKFILDNLNQQ